MKKDVYISAFIILIVLGWWIYILHATTYNDLQKTINYMDSLENKVNHLNSNDTLVIKYYPIKTQSVKK